MNHNNIKTEHNISTETRDDQKLKAIELMVKEFKLGDKWYLINSDWLKNWANFVGYEIDKYSIRNKLNTTSSKSDLPCKINNKQLVNKLKQEIYNEIHLKPGLSEDEYYYICEELWNYLVEIYSINSPEVNKYFLINHFC